MSAISHPPEPPRLIGAIQQLVRYAMEDGIAGKAISTAVNYEIQRNYRKARKEAA